MDNARKGIPIPFSGQFWLGLDPRAGDVDADPDVDGDGRPARPRRKAPRYIQVRKRNKMPRDDADFQ